MSRVLVVVLIVISIVLLGCGDEEPGFPNPLQIEFLTDEEESLSMGSITGQILFTDNTGQIRANPLSSNEYVIFKGSPIKVSGTALTVFVDFPSNNETYLMQDGYFQITHVDPGTHELILMRADDVIVEGDPDTLLEDSFAEIDVPTQRWVVTVEPDRNTAMGLVTVAIPGLEDQEWKSGEVGQEIIVPVKPEPPVIPTRPPVLPPIRPVNDEGLWFYYSFDFEEIDSGILAELSGYEDPGFQDLPAVASADGAPEIVRGVFGNAWRFNGVNTKINLNNFEAFERVFSTETVSVWFNVDETDRGDKVSMIYEEGGGTNGMSLLIADDKLIAAVRDDCVTIPNNALFLETPFTDAGRWHHVALVYNAGKLTLYLDGVERNSLETGYADDGGFDPPYIAAISQHTSDGAIGGSQGSCYKAMADSLTYFGGMLDDFRIYDYALTHGEIRALALGFAVEPQGKLPISWGALKNE